MRKYLILLLFPLALGLAQARECPSDTQAQAQPQVQEASSLVRSGQFRGASGHATGGTVSLYNEGSKFFLQLESNFNFDGAPDPKLGFSRDGRLVKSSVFAPLRRDQGRQVYELPAGFNPDNFDAVTLYCEQFDVNLGQAVWS